MNKSLDRMPLRNGARMEEASFWGRFFPHRKAMAFLLCTLLLGITLGSVLAVFSPLFEGRWMLPLRFSGIPSPESGFFACFSTLLLNALIGLIPLFLLGVTAFGVFAVPLFLFFRGATVGIGVSYFLLGDEPWGLLRSALIYTPASAAVGAFLLLFAVRSLIFSAHLAKVSFFSRDSNSWEGSLDLKLYFHDFLVILSFVVAASLAGSVPAAVYGLFL